MVSISFLRSHYVKELRRVPPHWLFVKESYESDFGALWGVFAYPGSIYKRGIGKSVWALKLAMITYSFIKPPLSDNVLDYVVYAPWEFLKVLKRAIDMNVKVPLVIWDDAGAWLFRARFREKFITAVVENMEVFRTHIGVLMFTATTPNKLVKGIRESLDLVDLIKFHSYLQEPGGTRWKQSRAYLYDADSGMDFLTFRQSPPTQLAQYMFLVKLPHELYVEYRNKREDYIKLGYRKLQKKLDDLAETDFADLYSEVKGMVEQAREQKPQKEEVEDRGVEVSSEEEDEEWVEDVEERVG